MISLVFKPERRQQVEVKTGNYLFFNPAPEADTISVTANMNGLTCMYQVVGSLGLDVDQMRELSNEVNKNYKITVFHNGSQRLIIVPKTNPSFYHIDKRCLVTDLLITCKQHKVGTLHFTHYGFLQQGYMRTEIYRLFASILNPLISDQIELDIVFDVDERWIDQIKEIYNSHIEKIYFLDSKRLKTLTFNNTTPYDEKKVFSGTTPLNLKIPNRKSIRWVY